MSRRCRRGMVAVACAFAVVAMPSSASADTFSITVKTDDSTVNGNCTLREAVQAASTNTAVDTCPAGSVGLDTILLDVGTYNVTIDGVLENLGETGDIDVQAFGGDLEIIGEGSNETKIKVSSDDRGFEVRQSAGNFKVADLTVEGSDDRANDGGLFSLGDSTAVVFDNTYLTNGQAQFGGAVYCGSGCDLTMTNTTVADNSVTALGTGFPNVVARGGAVEVQGIARFDRVTFRENEAIVNDAQARGGALYVSGIANVEQSYFGDNVARSSTNNAGSVRTGGAIQVQDGLVNVVNSTLSGNTADSTGASSSGGAVAVQGTASFNASATTFSSNNAASGTAIAADGGDAVVGTSIISSFDSDDFCGESNGGDVETSGFNVLDRAAPAGCFAGLSSSDDAVGDPGLPLIPEDNGGLTFSFALEPDSTPIDFVPKSECAEAGREDQRGLERPYGKRCDAGAYEYAVCAKTVVDERFIFGTPENETLRGNGAANKFAPSAGNDTIKAAGNKDFACGGSGNDKLQGGGSNDKLFGDAGKDKLDGGPGDDKCDGGASRDKTKRCERGPSN